MKNSNLSNIRRDVAIAVIKGTFAKTHREELLIDMIQKEVDPKSYKVQIYINDQFYNLIRDKKLTMKMTIGQMTPGMKTCSNLEIS